MATYVFVKKEDIFYTSQFSLENAWEKLREVYKKISGWKLQEKVEYD